MTLMMIIKGTFERLFRLGRIAPLRTIGTVRRFGASSARVVLGHRTFASTWTARCRDPLRGGGGGRGRGGGP